MITHFLFIVLMFATANAQITLVRPSYENYGTLYISNTTYVRIYDFQYVIVNTCNYTRAVCDERKPNIWFEHLLKPRDVSPCTCGDLTFEIIPKEPKFRGCSFPSDWRTHNSCKYMFANRTGEIVDAYSLNVIYTSEISTSASASLTFMTFVFAFTVVIPVFAFCNYKKLNKHYLFLNWVAQILLWRLIVYVYGGIF